MIAARQLLLPFTQRWRERRDSYRPAGEPLRTAEYDVAAIRDTATAKDFVVRHHYAASYPAARFRYGLYRQGALVGVAVYSHPVSDRVLTSVFPGAAVESVELGRFVLLDDVPANGETWFLARTFTLLKREGLVGVVSFSDPVPRTALGGQTVFLGHVGTIYQAGNAVYLGRGVTQTLRLLPDGRSLHHRAEEKIRNRERGWRYAAQTLVDHGADVLTERDDPTEWLARWLPRLTRRLRHTGNHKYAWSLDPRVRRHLPPSRPYPKRQFDLLGI